MNDRLQKKLISSNRKTTSFGIKPFVTKELNSADIDFIKSKLPQSRNKYNIKSVKKIYNKKNLLVQFQVQLQAAQKALYVFKREMNDIEIKYFNSISRPPVKDPKVKQKPSAQTYTSKPKRST